jgi:hypothetical protein
MVMPEEGQTKAPAATGAENLPSFHENAGLALLLCRLDFGVFPAEAFYTAGGIDQLLLARKEGMATRADFHMDIAAMGGAGRKAVTARAHDADLIISGMYACLHGSPNLAAKS